MSIYPLVTVGIPAYNRAKLLERALNSIIRQDYQNIEVIIADDCSPDDDLQKVIESYSHKILSLKYIRHNRNIGLIKNCLGLLDYANSKYFMWLADDDEISSNYISSLVSLLESSPDIATATGHWVLVLDGVNKKLMPTASFPQKSSLLRCLRFIWNTDDAFFYGVHRIDFLKQATFKGYWGPNKGFVANWCYVFLLDMVLKGRILLTHDKAVQFINHDYTEKNYSRPDLGIKGLFIYAIRRFNIHFLYWGKVAKSLGFIAVSLAIMVSFLSISREFLIFFGSILAGRISRFIRGFY